MKKNLENIAEIQTGYTFRNGLNKYRIGELGVIQLKDLKGSNIDFNNIDFINDDTIKENHLINKGDVIFKSRGEDNCSYMIDEEINAVAAAPVIILRVQKKSILPEYLNWYLNQTEAKEYFKSVSKGTLQKMISISNLKEMQIEIPDMNTQRLIVEIDLLLRKEKKIMEELCKKKEAVIAAKLSNILMEKANNE